LGGFMQPLNGGLVSGIRPGRPEDCTAVV